MLWRLVSLFLCQCLIRVQYFLTHLNIRFFIFLSMQSECIQLCYTLTSCFRKRDYFINAFDLITSARNKMFRFQYQLYYSISHAIPIRESTIGNKITSWTVLCATTQCAPVSITRIHVPGFDRIVSGSLQVWLDTM